MGTDGLWISWTETDAEIWTTKIDLGQAMFQVESGVNYLVPDQRSSNFMRPIIVLIVLALSSSQLYSENLRAFEMTVKYLLPGPGFVVTQQKLGDKVSTVFRFPSVHSSRYNLNVTADIAIIAQKLPENVTMDGFMTNVLSYTFKNPQILKESPFHEQLKCKIAGNVEVPFQYKDERGVTHDVLQGLVLDNKLHIGLIIIFDCTDDLYPELKTKAEELLNSFTFVD